MLPIMKEQRDIPTFRLAIQLAEEAAIAPASKAAEQDRVVRSTQLISVFRIDIDMAVGSSISRFHEHRISEFFPNFIL